MKFIVDLEDPNSFKGSHFKFLGHFLHVFAKERGVKLMIREEFMKDLRVVDESLVTGPVKLWLYHITFVLEISGP